MSQLSYAPTSDTLKVATEPESTPRLAVSGPDATTITVLAAGLVLAHVSGFGVRNALLGLAIFTGAILVPTLLHEFGHARSMRRSGLTVSHLAVGIGPRILHLRTSATSYEWNLFPLVGYARAEGMADLAPGARARIAFAGPAVNLLLALVALVAVAYVPSSETRHSLQLGGGAPGEVSQSDTDALFFAVAKDKEVSISRDGGEPIVGQIRYGGVEKVSDTEYRTEFILPTGDVLIARQYETEHSLTERVGLAKNALLLFWPGRQGGLGDAGKLLGFTLLFFAVNVAMAVFNLVPLLPLDGGHIALAGFDRVGKRRFLPSREAFAKHSMRLGLALILASLLVPIALQLI